MPLEAGTRLGTFEVLAPLGAGGMGEVPHADAGGQLDGEAVTEVIVRSVGLGQAGEI